MDWSDKVLQMMLYQLIQKATHSLRFSCQHHQSLIIAVQKLGAFQQIASE